MTVAKLNIYPFHYFILYLPVALSIFPSNTIKFLIPARGHWTFKRPDWRYMNLKNHKNIWKASMVLYNGIVWINNTNYVICINVIIMQHETYNIYYASFLQNHNMHDSRFSLLAPDILANSTANTGIPFLQIHDQQFWKAPIHWIFNCLDNVQDVRIMRPWMTPCPFDLTYSSWCDKIIQPKPVQP